MKTIRIDARFKLDTKDFFLHSRMQKAEEEAGKELIRVLLEAFSLLPKEIPAGTVHISIES